MLITTCSATETTLEPETFHSLSIANRGTHESYLQNLDSALNSRIQINVVGANASSDAKFEVLCLQEDDETTR
jgi:hypothetical protein